MNGLQKFYLGLWVTFGLTVIGLGVSGNLTMLALTVLGFISFGIIFMGMICVLPTTATHTAPSPAAVESSVGVRVSLRRRFLNAWSHPIGVEVNRPRLH